MSSPPSHGYILQMRTIWCGFTNKLGWPDQRGLLTHGLSRVDTANSSHSLWVSSVTSLAALSKNGYYTNRRISVTVQWRRHDLEALFALLAFCGVNLPNTDWFHTQRPWWKVVMMTSSDGNIFCVTGTLCGEFTVTGEFPSQRPVTRSLDVFLDLRLNKRLNKQSRRRWLETPLCSLWCHCNDDFYLSLAETNCLTNSWIVGDLRR